MCQLVKVRLRNRQFNTKVLVTHIAARTGFNRIQTDQNGNKSNENVSLSNLIPSATH